MSSIPVPGGPGPDALGLGVSMGHQGNAGLALDQFDQDIAFDDNILDNVNGLPLPFTPSYDFDTFSNATFDDPFTYSGAANGRPFEMQPHNPEGFNETSSPSEELDNKLLGFAAPVIKAAVVDENGQFTEPIMTAELFGMFFLAEDVYSTENTSRPLELTCYRRNLWWCSGQLTLPRQVTHIVTEGRQVPILELAASITAMESIEGKATEIICIPWKSTAANANNGVAPAAAQNEDTKVAGSPPNVLVDLTNGQELDNGRVSVPVSWKRLQFKHATANNGRRKGQQQHYVVQINLLGRVQPGSGLSNVITADKVKGGVAPAPNDNGEWVKIAEIQSGPVIVRGRSPRNFVSRRDVPLTGSSTAVDKNKMQQQQQQPQQPMQERHLSSASGIDMSGMHQLHRTNSGGIDMAHNYQRFNMMGGMQQTPNEWAQPYAQQSPHPAKKMALSPSMTRPPVPTWDTPSRTSKTVQQQHQLASQSQTQTQTQTQTLQQQLPPQQVQPAQSQYQYVVQPQQATRPNSSAMPLNLSLSEDERSPPTRLSNERHSNSPPFSNSLGTSVNASTGNGGVVIALPSTSSSTSAAAGNNATANQSDAFENGEMLYEYFPLSLDDWMPPVDAIYRPHVVHHTVVPPEVKAQQVRNKTKRYFAAE